MSKPYVAVTMTLMLAAVVSTGCADKRPTFGKGPVDLSKWVPINYKTPLNGQPYARWVLSPDKLSVKQEINADPSIFLSDLELGRTSISGTWLVDASDDDDFVGFVFAFQDPGRFYLFDWKGGTQNDGNEGLAKAGMAVKAVNVPYSGPAAANLAEGKPFDGKELWQTEGLAGKVKLLDFTETKGWEYHRPYQFILDFSPGAFRIRVKDGERMLYDKTIRDNAYAAGRFGFYNYSQDGVVYRNFAAAPLPPEPGRWWLMILVIMVIVAVAIVALVAGRKKA